MKAIQSLDVAGCAETRVCFGSEGAIRHPRQIDLIHSTLKPQSDFGRLRPAANRTTSVGDAIAARVVIMPPDKKQHHDDFLRLFAVSEFQLTS